MKLINKLDRSMLTYLRCISERGRKTLSLKIGKQEIEELILQRLHNTGAINVTNVNNHGDISVTVEKP